MTDFANDLLNECASILVQNEYDVGRVEIENGGELLLAENRFFIVGIAAAPTIDELPALESSAGAYLSDLVAESDVGAKRWDVYLALLTAQRPAEGSPEDTALFNMAYNTKYFRRVVRVGVSASTRDIGAALSTFLPLRSVDLPDVLREPLVLLEDELPAHGVDAEHAGRAIAAFRISRSVSDA